MVTPPYLCRGDLRSRPALLFTSGLKVGRIPPSAADYVTSAVKTQDRRCAALGLCILSSSNYKLCLILNK